MNKKINDYNEYLNDLMNKYTPSDETTDDFIMQQVKKSAMYQDGAGTKKKSHKKSHKKTSKYNLGRQIYYMSRGIADDNGNINNIELSGYDKYDVPYGGFPPIFLCNEGDVQKNETKEREYSKTKMAVSITDIMNKRRDNKPFVLI